MSLITFNTASPDHAEDIAKIHVQSWQEGYKGIIHQEYLHALDIQQKAKSWENNLKNQRNTVIACQNDEVVGFAAYGPSRNPSFPKHAELYAIYIAPEKYGMGIGTKLLNFIREKYKDKGGTKMFVNVLKENKRGRNFYKYTGANLVPNSTFNSQIDGHIYQEVIYEWDSLL